MIATIIPHSRLDPSSLSGFPELELKDQRLSRWGCRRNRLGEPILMPLPNPLLAEFDIHFTMYLDLKVVTAFLILTDYSIFWDGFTFKSFVI